MIEAFAPTEINVGIGYRYDKSDLSLIINDNLISNNDIEGSFEDRLLRFLELYQEKLEFLNLSGCTSLKFLPENLPESLQEINLSVCTSLTYLPENLPENLRFLNLWACTSLESLPEKLPKNLKSLNLSGCISLVSLPENLPENLHTLDLSGCTSLTSLPEDLPENLHTLDLSGCTLLTSLPKKLPKNLQNLFICGCTSLEVLPENLPENLKILKSSKCTSLTSLPKKLPKSLEYLDLIGCSSLVSLPKELPESLKDLYLTGCTSLTSLPENLSRNLKILNLCECSSLASLPENLPEGLYNMDLSGCTSLKSLPENLPKSLRSLYLTGCTSLTSLPENLPEGLEYLDLSGCVSFPNNPETVKKIRNLESANSNLRIIWPEHLSRDFEIININKNLIEAYRIFKKDDELSPNFDNKLEFKNNFPLFYFLLRFAKEKVEDRGYDILEEALEISEIIKNNPDLLNSFDKITEGYLDECVNQPVACFSEIATLCKISVQESIEKKLETAKILYAKKLIKANAIEQSGDIHEVQAEYANAMLREVHKLLLEKNVISEKWTGIPQVIIYEGAISSRLTEQNIDKIYRNISEKLSETSDLWNQIAITLCEDPDLQDFWANEVLKKEIRDEIMKPHEEAKKKYIEDYFSENSQQNINQEVRMTEEKLKKIELQCREKILSEAKSITLREIEKLRPSKAPSSVELSEAKSMQRTRKSKSL